MSWLDDLFDCFDGIFNSSKDVNDKSEFSFTTSVKKSTAPTKKSMTVAEAMAKLEELNNTPHLEELEEISGFDAENYMLKKDDKYYYGRSSVENAKIIFSENNILAHPTEMNNFSKLKCDDSSTNIEKEYTVKVFKGRYDYAYGVLETDRRKLQVIYYNSIKKYALIVMTGYCHHYVSKPYDDLKTLQQEVLTLAEIIKLEKEIKELAVKELEETAWS
jgi:hypothetical protein